MDDLWPQEIGGRVRTPVAILREQASFLGQKTQNLVQGEVIDQSNEQAKGFLLRQKQ